MARALLPIVLVLLAAGIRETRVAVLVALVAGTLVAVHRGASVRWAWAAPVPVALSLAFGLIPPPIADPSGLDCTSIASPPALWRLLEAILVLGVLGLLAIILRAPADSLWLRRPSLWAAGLGVAGFGLFAVLGLALGPSLARPFFGAITLDTSRPLALVPALVFALANGVMEETAYRGALLSWSARVIGLAPALVLQAIVFGLAHGGPDVIAGSLPPAAGLALGGVLAGVVAIRTRSLIVPIAIHVALDLPLYVYLACRTG
ncbi:MAG: protease family protein [Chloroflexota bacterium]|jgi:membrane protease YdiL (CAAX protease family)|nr:protease family protein [Chloroflexota bacterium]